MQARLGTGIKDRLATKARFAPSPATLVAGLLKTGGRTTMKALRKAPAGVDLGPLRPTTRAPADREPADRPYAGAAGLRPRPGQRGPRGGPLGAHELLLIGRRHKQDCNSWLHNAERLTRGKPRHHLLMHPQDLAERGIDDGAVVRVTSRMGTVDVEVSGVDDMMPGVVSLPHGYGHQVAGTRMRHAATVAGVSINDLTDPERLDVSGNAALNGVPVTVHRSDLPRRVDPDDVQDREHLVGVAAARSRATALVGEHLRDPDSSARWSSPAPAMPTTNSAGLPFQSIGSS